MVREGGNRREAAHKDESVTVMRVDVSEVIEESEELDVNDVVVVEVVEVKDSEVMPNFIMDDVDLVVVDLIDIALEKEECKITVPVDGVPSVEGVEERSRCNKGVGRLMLKPNDEAPAKLGGMGILPLRPEIISSITAREMFAN